MKTVKLICNAMLFCMVIASSAVAESGVLMGADGKPLQGADDNVLTSGSEPLTSDGEPVTMKPPTTPNDDQQKVLIDEDTGKTQIDEDTGKVLVDDNGKVLLDETGKPLKSE